jgi:hypothetical protein
MIPDGLRVELHYPSSQSRWFQLWANTLSYRSRFASPCVSPTILGQVPLAPTPGAERQLVSIRP